LKIILNLNLLTEILLNISHISKFKFIKNKTHHNPPPPSAAVAASYGTPAKQARHIEVPFSYLYLANMLKAASKQKRRMRKSKKFPQRRKK